MSGRLRGKVALVTGAASGLGRQSALRMAEEGALVCLADIDDEGGRESERMLGPRAFYLHHDVTCERSWRAAIDATLDRFGKLQVLVNSAGIARDGDDIETCDDACWQAILDVNLTGTWLGCRQAIAAMKRAGGGSIVNLCSVLALRGAGYAMAYCASKGAVRLLTKSIAVHCGRAGLDIRCNAICPGYMATPMGRAVEASVGSEEYRRLIARHALGRMGDSDDVAHMAVYLASDESRFVTGAEMVVDGGYTAG